jgi:DNA-binding transcriptional ArsR family regulator
MPERKAVAKELAEIFKVMAHPDRIRIIEQLGGDEKDVNTLVNELELPGPRVSQHLSLLRAHRLVDERREGRHHFYRLHQPKLADWVMHGLEFLEGRLNGVTQSTISSARDLWSSQSGA